MALAHAPHAAAAELPAFVPLFFEHDLIRRGRMEGLAMHLRLRDVPLRGQTHRDGMRRRPGDRIGRYELLHKIGVGGGVVYMAEQEEPARRRVALKVITLGMDTRSVIARFEAERQALAPMDHTNIAKVLAAGATGPGRPYFVMERVRGIRFVDYCDQHKLPVRLRLDLFVQVCQAIQHAHQKGISIATSIHRKDQQL